MPALLANFSISFFPSIYIFLFLNCFSNSHSFTRVLFFLVFFVDFFLFRSLEIFSREIFPFSFGYFSYAENYTHTKIHLLRSSSDQHVKSLISLMQHAIRLSGSSCSLSLLLDIYLLNPFFKIFNFEWRGDKTSRNARFIYRTSRNTCGNREKWFRRMIYHSVAIECKMYVESSKNITRYSRCFWAKQCSQRHQNAALFPLNVRFTENSDVHKIVEFSSR